MSHVLRKQRNYLKLFFDSEERVLFLVVAQNLRIIQRFEKNAGCPVAAVLERTIRPLARSEV